MMPGGRIRARRWLALLAVVLAAVAVLALNLFGRLVLERYRLDVTEERLFTITDATRRVLGSLKEPVTLRFYFSRALAERAAPYAEHGARVAAMLRRYAELAPGRLQVEVVDPEPYSEEEDRAIAAGLQPVPLPDGRNAWFGIVGENTTGQREVLGFLPVERAALLEYDLTLLVHRLGLPRKPVVGVLTSLPVFGRRLPGGRGTGPWAIVAQLKSFYEVRRIDARGKGEELKDIDVLLLITPVAAGEEELWRAVERHVLAGRPTIMALDPNAEVAMTDMALIGMSALKKTDTLVKMLRHWGVEPPVGRFVADPEFARQVVFRDDDGRRRRAPWLAWLQLDGNAFARQYEALFVNVGSINMGSAGAVALREGTSLKGDPVIAASGEARLLDVQLLFPPDPLKVLDAYLKQRDKQGAGQQRPWLALRVTGRATAYFGAQPAAGNAGEAKGQQTAGAKPARAGTAAADGSQRQGQVNLLLVGDSDFLANRFWARLQDIGGGRQLVLPLAGNATFMLNALAQMAGGEVLAGLSGRMLKERPFERIEEIRRAAETQYRAREQQLQQQLKAAEKRLAGITARVEGDRLVISARDRQRILQVRQEILQLRRRLRDVQQALVRDIRQLEFRIKALNIVGAALLVALLGLLVWGWERWAARRVAGRAG